MSTHIIEDVQSVCNRLIVIIHGRILFDGIPMELIKIAEGHVGVLDAQTKNNSAHKYKTTAQVFTTQGVSIKVVGEKLPKEEKVVEPSLEDAYMYIIARRQITKQALFI